MDDGIHTYEKLNETTNNIRSRSRQGSMPEASHQHSKAVRFKNKHRHAQTEQTRSLKFAEWSFTLGRHETHQPTHQPTNWQPTNIPTHQHTNNQPHGHSPNQPIKKATTWQPTKQPTDKPTTRQTNQPPTNRPTNKPTDQPTNQLPINCQPSD